MSGHSKWATTKHKKAAVDAKRGKIFTRIIKEIAVAARLGGGDPDGNPRLRTAVAKAKESNMPADNIKKAIQRGTGELPGVNYEETVYEGYGPGGVAILIEIMTDNKNRTISEIRQLMGKNGGNLGEAGCVSWMFEKKGYIVVEHEKIDEDRLMGMVLEAGAEDMKTEGNQYEIFTFLKDFEGVKGVLEKESIEMVLSEITAIPQTHIKLEGKEAEQMLRLMEALENHDDVQNVYANFDIPDDVIEKAAAKS
ncbi:MAG TPA: YebC/PmpR family DNA-binding transcriptional regulator [Nitrospiria bacterium]